MPAPAVYSYIPQQAAGVSDSAVCPVFFVGCGFFPPSKGTRYFSIIVRALPQPNAKLLCSTYVDRMCLLFSNHITGQIFIVLCAEVFCLVLFLREVLTV